MLQLPVGPFALKEQFDVEIVGNGPVIAFIVVEMSGSDPDPNDKPAPTLIARKTPKNVIRIVGVDAITRAPSAFRDDDPKSPE